MLIPLNLLISLLASLPSGNAQVQIGDPDAQLRIFNDIRCDTCTLAVNLLVPPMLERWAKSEIDGPKPWGETDALGFV